MADAFRESMYSQQEGIQEFSEEQVFDWGIHFFLCLVEYFSVSRGVNSCTDHWALGSGKNIWRVSEVSMTQSFVEAQSVSPDKASNTPLSVLCCRGLVKRDGVPFSQESVEQSRFCCPKLTWVRSTSLEEWVRWLHRLRGNLNRSQERDCFKGVGWGEFLKAQLECCYEEEEWYWARSSPFRCIS